MACRAADLFGGFLFLVTNVFRETVPGSKRRNGVIAALLVGLQRGPTVYHALETHILESSQFVLGSIGDVRKKTIAGTTTWTIQVRVAEVFRGPNVENITIVQSEPLPSPFTNALASGKNSFWRRQSERGDWTWFTLESPSNQHGGHFGSLLPIFSMDFTILRNSDQAVNAARRFAADMKIDPRPRVVNTIVPATLAEEVAPIADGIIFKTVLNHRSKQIAQNLISNPYHYLLPSSRYGNDPHGRRREAEELQNIGRSLLEQMKDW